MPLNSLFLCCVTLVCSFFIPSMLAADCTSAQIAELSTLRSNVTAVCGDDALSTTTTAYCADSSCLAYLTSMISSVPSCEISSYNLRTVLTTAINSCNAASDAVPASKSASQSLHHYQLWTTALLVLQVAVLVGIVL